MQLLTRHLAVVLGFLCLLSGAQIVERDSTSEIPSCSLDCLTTLVPEYGCSLTNATCVCVNAPLTLAVTTCASAACNVTDSLLLAKYQSDSCGVKNNKIRQVKQIYSLLIEFSSTCFFVAARFYSRMKLSVGLGADDWMILAAFTVYAVDFAAGLCIPFHGFGQHTWYLTTKQVEDSLMYFYICEPVYIVAITFTKLSLLLFFRRIFPNEKMNMIIYGVMGFIALSNAILTLCLTFQCIPFTGNWTNWEHPENPSHCINRYATVFAAAGFSIFHDILVVLTPLPVLWKLKLNMRKKMGLIFMFSVGMFVVICSLIRLPSLLTLENSSDPSWDQAYIAIWTGLETCVGIMCACLPAIRSLVAHLFPGLKMSISSEDATPGYHNSRGYGTGSRTLTNNKLSQIRRTDSQASFFELDERERGTAGSGDKSSAFSKKSAESVAPFKGEQGVTVSSVGTGEDHKAQKGIVITTHIRQKRSDS